MLLLSGALPDGLDLPLGGREATKGQLFRIDTADGPLFIQGCLWRFSGQTGGYFEGQAESKRRGTPPPTWGHEWRLTAAAREVA